MRRTIAVVCSEFNKELVGGLYAEADQALKEYQNLEKPALLLEKKQFWVSGVGEIPLAVDWLFKSKTAQAVLALGVVIRGQTGHYDFLSNFLQRALWDLQKSHSLPLVFSVLLLENRNQAKERMHRGAEGMKSLIQMMELQQALHKKNP